MKLRVRLKVEGGVVYVFHVPEGVEVEVIDYDVPDPMTSETDDSESEYSGERCVHYVQKSDGSSHDCEYNSDEGWQEWNNSK